MDREQLARRLLRTFGSEVEEQTRALNAYLLALEERPGDSELLQSVFRVAHTLKGAARAAGVRLVEQVFHALESRLAELRDGKRQIDESDLSLLFDVVDVMQEAVASLREGREVGGSGLPELLAVLTGGPVAAARPPPSGSHPTRQPSPRARHRTDQVRVDAAKLDGLLAAAGELVVERARALHRDGEITTLAEDVARFAAQWRSTGRTLLLAADRDQVAPRAREKIRTLDEAVRQLARRASRIASLTSRATRGFGAAVDRVARRTHELRMRSFGEAAEPLARTVRDLAKAAGKEVRLEIEGADVEADRAVLDGLRDALLQLVRNAVDHGVEAPTERERRQKPRAGTVGVAATLRGDRIVVTVRDDGAGLDEDRNREALTARGVPPPEDDADMGQALLAGRVSTKAEASTISGRGVGLDIVREAVERIRGTVAVTWEAGGGTTFTIDCPPSLATMRAVLVGAGAHFLLIPTTHVARLSRVRVADIHRSQGRQVVETEEGPVPLVSLARVLGPPLVERPVADVVSFALLEHGSRRLGVAVDELVAEQEVVVEPIERNGVAARYVSGATVLGSGRVAPVLNTAAVVEAGLGETVVGGVEVAEPRGGRQAPRVLVVDDSITTRTLEESVLQAAGYDVTTAVDGADAWRAIQEHGCDLVVADVDMPRMDGFDLCRAIRASKRFRELPVILVTALESPEHRQRGMEVGADAYIGKSGFDQQHLIETVRQLLG